MRQEARASERSPEPSIRHSLDAFYRSKVFTKNAPNTQLAYIGDLEDFSRYLKAKEIPSLLEVTTERIADYLKGFIPSTSNRRRAAIRNFFNWVTTIRQVSTDPSADLLAFKFEVKHRLYHLTEEEVQKLQKAVQGNSRDAALVALALNTGALVSEILNLDVENVHRDGQGISVNLTNRKREERAVPLDEETSRILQDHLENLPKTGPIFTERRGDPEVYSQHRLTRQGFWIILKRYGKAPDITDLSPTILRNTFIVNFQGSSKELASILGTSQDMAYRLGLKKRLTLAQTPQIPEP